jgi:hypothetical protein
MPKDLSSLYHKRSDFERGANLLKECIENGRMRFASHLEQEFDSLGRVRTLPNGRLNLDTVDELVRTNFSFLVSNPFDRVYETKG